MPSQIDVYVDANNKTGKVDLVKAKNIVEKYKDGYSIFKLDGIWKSKREPSVMFRFIHDAEMNIESMTDYSVMVSELKKELEQDSVLVTVTLLNKVQFV